MDAQSSEVSVSRLSRLSDGKLLAVMLAVALLLRIAVIPIVGLHHPDELWQYLEPAHKLAFGSSVDAWEFRAGIRTWIIPVTLAPFMWLGDALAPGTLWYIYLPKTVLALFSLTIVYVWWRLGRQLSPLHGLVAVFVAAIWAELVYFGARPLSEPVSMALFFAAVALLAQDKLARKQLALAGFLLGLTFCVRFQLAPALLGLILWTERRRFRKSMPWIIAGGLAGLALDGLIDFMVGQTPLLWIIENFRINLIEGKSAHYGVKAWWYYLAQPVRRWNLASGPIFMLAIIGARRFPGLTFVAVTNILFHSLIPHKEFRFALLSYEIVIFLAAIGTADVIRLTQSNSRRGWLTLAGAGWASASLMVALIVPLGLQWQTLKAQVRTLMAAGNSPKVCGLAIYDLERPLSAAYTFYHRDTPIYAFLRDEKAFRSHQDRFNLVIAYPKKPPGPPYSMASCHYQSRKYPPLCLYERPGTCTAQPAPEFEINRVLVKHGM